MSEQQQQLVQAASDHLRAAQVAFEPEELAAFIADAWPWVTEDLKAQAWAEAFLDALPSAIELPR
jgi:hypothetical protein